MEKDSTINIHKAEALYALLTDEEKEIIKKLREMKDKKAIFESLKSAEMPCDFLLALHEVLK